MKKFNKKMIEGSVSVGLLGAFDGAVDSANMGAIGTATKTTAKAGFIKKFSRGWF